MSGAVEEADGRSQRAVGRGRPELGSMANAMLGGCRTPAMVRVREQAHGMGALWTVLARPEGGFVVLAEDTCYREARTCCGGVKGMLRTDGSGRGDEVAADAQWRWSSLLMVLLGCSAGGSC